jgi:hypothetical protein
LAASSPVAGGAGRVGRLQAEGGLKTWPGGPAHTQGGRGLFERGPEQSRQEHRLTLPKRCSGQLRPLNYERVNPSWSGHAAALPLFASS